MDKRERLNWRIERLEADIQDTKEQLGSVLDAVSKNFSFAANLIKSNDKRWFNDADYVEHNCSWIAEYSKRIAAFEHDIKIMKDMRDMMFDDE